MEFQAVRGVNKNMLQKQALAFTRGITQTTLENSRPGPGSNRVYRVCYVYSRALSQSRSAEVVVAVAHAPVQVDAPSRESKHGWKWSSRQGHELPYATADSSGSRDGPNVLTLAARCPRPSAPPACCSPVGAQRMTRGRTGAWRSRGASGRGCA